jgi:hypothetical protein
MGGARWAWRQEIARTPVEGVLQITVRVRSDDPGRAAPDDRTAWLVAITGARGAAVSLDPLADRAWDAARRSPP